MQNRNAIILSLGMLLEKVDTSGFIVNLLRKAKEENPEFVFTPDLRAQLFGLSEDFNLGKVQSEVFEYKILQWLGINEITSDEFWSEWNNMLTVGKIAEKIQLLQEVGRQHNMLAYLSSDTNPKHLAQIVWECAKQGIAITATTQPVLFGQFPLYASCQVGKNHHSLMQYIVGEIKSKEFNKPESITLIVGNPENIEDERFRVVVQRHCDQVIAWCKENGVSVQLHNQSLEETLTKIFTPESAAANTPAPALS